MGITRYLTKIRPLLEYGPAIWGGLPDHLANELENVQKRSLDIIFLPRDSLPSLEERRKTITTRELQRILEDSDHQCHTMILKPTEHQYNLRTKNLCQAVRSGTERHKEYFIPRAVSIIEHTYKICKDQYKLNIHIQYVCSVYTGLYKF